MALPPPLVYCAIYTRISVRFQGDDLAVSSCVLQRDACMQFIHEHRHLGWIPLAWPFNDDGKSGASMDRPALDRLLDVIASGRAQGTDVVHRIVVHRFDRLTRSVHDFAFLQRLLEEHNVGLSIVQGAFSGPPNAITQLRLNTLAAFAQFEREMMAERMAEGRAAKRARGLRVAGVPPFGYAINPKTKQLVVHPKQSKTIHWMFARADGGGTPAEITTIANTWGDKNMRGEAERWSTETVLRILRNQVYAGRLPDGTRGVHTPLVGADVFARVNEAIGKRRTREPTPRPEGSVDPFLLRGLLKCWRCGRPMTTSSTGKIAKPGARYYRCRRRGCVGAQLPALAIESRVTNSLATPPANLDPQARAACAAVAGIWELLTPANRSRMMGALFKEIRWDSMRGALEWVVDPETAAELVHDAAAG
jgi:site-specific DNA recombinase